MRSRSFALLALSVVCSMAVSAASRAQEPCAPPAGKRIHGGEDAEIKNHPWQVAVEVDGALCGGVIITPSWVLTAAHCFDSEDPRKVRVKAGATNYRIGGAWTLADRVVLHDQYDRHGTKENDLALVKLRTRPAGKTIPLAKPDLELARCQKLEVTGWGQTEDRRGAPASQKLQMAEVPYIDNDTCNERRSYNGAIRPRMMCAGSEEKDACLGDSGGPLVLRSTTDGPVLVGIVSFGPGGCAKRFKYGVYTRVSAYREWITKVTTRDQTR